MFQSSVYNVKDNLQMSREIFLAHFSGEKISPKHERYNKQHLVRINGKQSKSSNMRYH